LKVKLVITSGFERVVSSGELDFNSVTITLVSILGNETILHQENKRKAALQL
jgi:hypothetical protein